jgi:hypothetical protein
MFLRFIKINQIKMQFYKEVNCSRTVNLIIMNNLVGYYKERIQS